MPLLNLDLSSVSWLLLFLGWIAVGGKQCLRYMEKKCGVPLNRRNKPIILTPFSVPLKGVVHVLSTFCKFLMRRTSYGLSLPNGSARNSGLIRPRCWAHHLSYPSRVTRRNCVRAMSTVYVESAYDMTPLPSRKRSTHRLAHSAHAYVRCQGTFSVTEVQIM